MPVLTKQNLYFLACTSFIIGLVVQDFFKIPLTGGIIILGLTWIFSAGYAQKFKLIASKPLALAIIFFFLLHLISVTYSENTHSAWKDVQLKISLFLMPLFMLSTNIFSQKLRRLLLTIFVLSMATMAIYDLYTAFGIYQELQDSSVFFYQSLPQFFVDKPHYTSWYYSFAFFIIIHKIIEEKKRNISWFILALVFLISVLLLSSRIYLIALVSVFFITSVKWIRPRLTSKKMQFFSVFIALTLPLMIVLIPQTKSRLMETLDEVKEIFVKDTNKETNARVYIWAYAMELIKGNPIIGYGVGDAKTELNVLLKDCKAKFWDGKQNVPIYQKNYNFHNQFLQTWAEVGILGVVLLLFFMIRPLTLKNQHPLFLIFLVLTFIGFLTESMFERQVGVVLFAVMYPLLSELDINTSAE